MKPARILHLHSSFSLGGKEARAVQLMNAFGAAAEHVVVSGVPGRTGARTAIDPAIEVHFPDDFPSLTGRPSAARYRALAQAMRSFDLVLTYNWGAIDAVMARRFHDGPPLIHHEDGFNDDEARRQKPLRILWRRIALGAAHALVVPSETLEAIALKSWGQPRTRVRRIANGIDLTVRHNELLKGVPRLAGEVALVTIAGLRKVKDLTTLVYQLAQLNETIPARLTIMGEGPERAAIAKAAHEQGVESRVHLVGFVADPARHLGQFDIFALSSLSEQFPISVVEAMAAGLPVVSTDVGDVRSMIAAENQPFVAAAAYDYHRALVHLAADSIVRRSIGDANRAKAVALYDEQIMIRAYRALYAEAIGRPGAFG